MDQGMLLPKGNKMIPSVEELRCAAIRDDWRKLLVKALVLLVTIPTLFKYSGGEPVFAVWSLSLFLVFYLFCCTCFLSNAATPLAKIFISLSFIALLAFFAGSLLRNMVGMVIMYLDSFLAACIFGSTLAQYRESNATERAALVAAVANAPVINKQSMMVVHIFLGFLTMCCAPFLLWTMLDAECDAIDVSMGLLAGLRSLSFFHMIFVVDGAFFGDDGSSGAVCLWWVTVIMLSLVTSVLMGDLVAVIVLCLCILASATFIGYCLRLHDSYEQITFWRNHLPPLIDGSR